MTLRVLGYNIQEGGEDRLAGIAAVIRAQRPDAVTLLEANSRANAERLARDLGMHLAFGEANTPYHIAWLTRLPVQRAENHRLPMLAKTLLAIEVRWDGLPVYLFAAHLGSRWDVPKPVTEIPAILDVLHPYADAPHLLVGDFNALTPGDPVGIPPDGAVPRGEARDGAPRPALGPLRDAGYTDCYRALHPRAVGYTYPTARPWLRLDYIFASPRMAGRLADCRVCDTVTARRASDHLPIRATFR